MTIRVSAAGWVRSVNGLPVTKKALSSGFYRGWPRAPKGVMLHGTAGCSPSIHAVLSSRGISVHFCIDRDGNIEQYVSLKDRAAHAYDANHTHWAIEHTGQHPSCPGYTPAQRNASAKLVAGLIEYADSQFGQTIPVRHVPGAELNVLGLKEHADGTNPTAYWNPNVHVDNPGSHWGWATYLATVKAVVSPEVPRAYLYRSKRYTSLKMLLRRLRRGLKNSELREAHTVRVVKRDQ